MKNLPVEMVEKLRAYERKSDGDAPEDCKLMTDEEMTTWVKKDMKKEWRKRLWQI